MIPHTAVFQMSGPLEDFLEYILQAIDTLTELCIAVMLGIALGWLLGFLAGRSYVEHCQPAYLSQYKSLAEISEWSLMSFRFAIIGGYVGGLVGAVVGLAIQVRAYLRK